MADLFNDTPDYIARVIIDNDLPHLDKTFDYAITPEKPVEPGQIVRVRFAGKLTTGWVIAVSEESSFKGKLQPIERVLTPQPVFTPQMVDLARELASRHAAPVAKVLSAMIPPRHAGAEKQALQLLKNLTTAKAAETGEPNAASLTHADSLIHAASLTQVNAEASESATPEPNEELYTPYQGGPEYAQHLKTGHPLRAIWQLIPGDFPIRDAYAKSAFIDAVFRSATAQLNGTTLVIVPTQREVNQFLNDWEKQTEKTLEESTKLRIGTLTSTDTPAKRYSTYILAQNGYYQIVVGTRSAVYQPVRKLNGIFIYDDGDGRHEDPQAPYVSTLDVAIRRSQQEKSTLIVAGNAPSVQATALAESGWTPWLLPHPRAQREQTAVVTVVDKTMREQQGSAGLGRLPAFVQTKIRKALLKGPVLVSVPRRGWISIIRCQECKQTGCCVRCHGPLRAGQVASGVNGYGAKGSSATGYALSCAWCADPQYAWKCSYCESSRWVPARLGSARTFEELGRAFPTVNVLQADAEHYLEELPAHKPALVVATPGAEPLVKGGFELVVILDAEAVVSRPELWATEEAMRRWMRLLGFVKSSGEVAVLGLSDESFAQALIRRDPVAWARQTLTERVEVGFYPAKCLLAVDGALEAVTQFAEQLSAIQLSEVNVETLGVAPRVGKDVPKAFHPQPTRLLLRVSWKDAPVLLQVVRRLQAERSLKKLGLTTVRVNPRDLL